MINDILGADGAGYPVVIGYERDAEGRPVFDDTGELKGGMRLTLSPVTQAVKGGFEAWLLQLGRQDVLAWRGDATPEEMAKLMMEFSVRKTAGAYSWLGPIWREKFQTEAGQERMLYLLTREHHPKLLPDEIHPLVAEHLEDVALAVSEVVTAGNRSGHQRNRFQRWPTLIFIRKGISPTSSPKHAASSPVNLSA